MINLGVFQDTTVNASYTLYRMNARVLKEKLDKREKLTNLKLNMFNSSTSASSDIRYVESRFHDSLQVDYKKGEISTFNGDTINDRFDLERIDKAVSKPNINKRQENNHRLGYELMPLVVMAEDMNIDSELILLDGFRRMYYVNEVPDMDVFVKVYGLLEPDKWQTAMLLFNSWKIAPGRFVRDDSYHLYIDRGYKFGLYTYFGIDITLYEDNALEVFQNYINRSFYDTLKDNQYAHIDLLTSLLAYEEYSTNNWGMRILINYIFKVYGSIRRIEFNLSRRVDAEVMTVDMLREFVNREKMKRHVKRVKEMKTPGHIENYVKRETELHVLNFFRELYGLKPVKKELADIMDMTFGTGERFFYSVEELEDVSKENNK